MNDRCDGRWLARAAFGAAVVSTLACGDADDASDGQGGKSAAAVTSSDASAGSGQAIMTGASTSVASSSSAASSSSNGCGAIPPDPVVGDCHRLDCVGSAIVEVVDPADVPQVPVCNEGTCDGGTPQVLPLPPLTPCGANLTCDGDGSCVGCFVDAQCPPDDFCVDSYCAITGECAQLAALDHTPCTGHPGVCSAGACVECMFDEDCPAPASPCQGVACTAGNVCTSFDLLFGTSCPGGQCDGGGQCRECAIDDDCPSDDCHAPSCQQGVCALVDVPDGDACRLTPGMFCDAAGVCGDCAEPCAAGGECEVARCPGGTCSTTTLGLGMPCPTGPGWCDASGACVECTTDPHCPGASRRGPSADHSCNYETCVDGECVLAWDVDGTVCDDALLCQNHQCNYCTGSNGCDPFVCCVGTGQCVPTLFECM